MNLNLHIIRDELSDIPFHGTIHTTPWDFPLTHVMFCDGSILPEDTGILYVCDTSHLPDFSYMNKSFFILCSGKPDDIWLHSQCSFLYTEAAVTATQLLNRILLIFRTYQLWEQQMEEILASEQPIRVLGKTAIPFLNNPLFLQGSRFQCLFQIIPIPPKGEPLTNNQKKYLDLYTIADNDFMPSDEFNEYFAKKEYQYTTFEKNPVLMDLDDGSNFQMIYLNLFLNNTPIAFVCLDNVFRPFQDKDYAILVILGEFLKKYLMKTEIYTLSRSRGIDQLLRDLLNRKTIPQVHIKKLLALLNWELNDTYFCIILKPIASSQHEDALSSIALRISSHFTNSVYIIHEQSIFFIFNISHTKQTQRELFTASLPLFRDYMLLGGCSTEFYNFQEFPDYCIQAQNTLEIGQQLNPSFWFFFYDDYLMPYLLKGCQNKTAAALLIPNYLKKLLAYDTKKNTSYIELLDIYLSHDRNVTDTAAHAEIHRTTVLYRLKRIQEITSINLDDYQTRLATMISLQILKQQTNNL